jgi:hypothetical protein
MSDEPQKPPMNLTPSGSTYGSITGGALATIVVIILDKFGIDFQAGFEAALAVVFTALGGYFPKSGRQ